MLMQMETRDIVICIALAVVTTNLIRVLPVVLIRGHIRHRFIRSFLYYVPYVTLSVMTFPSIVETTVSPLSGLVAFAAGVVAAWRGLGLFPVAALCCVIVYVMDFLLTLL